MATQNVYDLAVIGAGPAGIVGATTAASLRARVVLIDSGATVAVLAINGQTSLQFASL